VYLYASPLSLDAIGDLANVVLAAFDRLGMAVTAVVKFGIYHVSASVERDSSFVELC
jgi:hypothetical protein